MKIHDTKEGKNMKNKKFFILALLWMAMIFYMSNQPAHISSAQSSGVIEMLSGIPIVGNVIKKMIELDIAQFIIRKAAHLSAFCILAILIFMSLYNDIKMINIVAFKSMLFTFLYACTDEFHQFFIPGRSSEFRDVMIDSTGGFIGIIIVYIIIKLANKKCRTKY